METKERNLFTDASVVSSKRILYTPSEFARNSLLHLQEIGTLKALQPHVSSRSNLSSYLFFKVLSGKGSMTYKGNTYSLSEGDMVFINCHFSYSHATSVDLWSLRWCHFFGPMLSFIYDKYCERGGKPVFRSENNEEFDGLLNELYQIACGNDYVRDMMINEKLNQLCTLLMRESWHPEISEETRSKRTVVLQVKEYLDRHYAEKITLDQLSDQFYINKYYLTRLFKDQFGTTINAYLLRVRITQAKQLLRFTDYTVEVIGFHCGFGQLSYFSKVFREIEGVSPSAYRKQW